MAPIPGSVRVTGFIAPSDSIDDYPTHDALYGMDGLRSVADNTARNAIPNARRREGMMVFTRDSTTYWRLLAGPWTGTDADWVNAGIGTATITTGKTLWVDATFGSDVTGLTQRQDKPFATIAAAVAAAVSGDLVIVRPGTYTVASNLYKNGVSVYLEQGSTVSYTATMIDDTAATGGIFRILGYGAFAGADDVQLISISASTKVVFEADTIDLGTGAAAIPISAALTATGILNLSARAITGARTQVAARQTTGGNVYISVSQSWAATGAGGVWEQSAGTSYITCPELSAAGAGHIVSLTAACSCFLNANSLTCASATALRAYAAAILNASINGPVTASIGVDANNSQVYFTCRWISATSVGINNVQALVYGVVQRFIQVSGVAVAAGSNSTYALYVGESISGTTAGIQATGGTTTTRVTCPGEILASAGPAVDVGNASVVLNIVGPRLIRGTTFGVRITAATDVEITSEALIQATAGVGLSVSGASTNAITCKFVTGTTGGVAVSAGTLFLTCDQIGASAGNGVAVSGTGTLRAIVKNGAQISVGAGSAITVSGTGSAEVDGGAFSAVGASTVIVTGGTLKLSCTGITCTEATSDAVSVAGGTVAIKCNGTISGQVTGVHLLTGASTVSVSALVITCAASWRAIWVEAGAGASSLHVTAEHIDGSSRGIQIDDDASVWLAADLIDADEGLSSIAIDCDSAAAALVVTADTISSAGDGVFIQAGVARVTASRVIAAANALRGNNGGVGPAVSFEANIADLIESTGSTAISILSERFILGGSAAVRAAAICASLAIPTGETATLKCGSMTATGVGSGCIASTADGAVDVNVDGPLVADLRGVQHTGAGNVSVRCASITVSSATARAIDASGDTGSHLTVVVAGDVVSTNRALYMDTDAQTQDVRVHVAGRMQGRGTVVEVLADGRLYLTADEITVESGQDGHAVTLQAVTSFELLAWVTVGRVYANGANQYGLYANDCWVFASLKYVEADDASAIYADNGAEIDATLDYAVGCTTSGSDAVVRASAFGNVYLRCIGVYGGAACTGLLVEDSGRAWLSADYVSGGSGGGIVITGGNITGSVTSVDGAIGIDSSGGACELQAFNISGTVGAAVSCSGENRVNLVVGGMLLGGAGVAVDVTATALNPNDGISITGGKLQGGDGVITRDGAADYRIEIRNARVVSQSTPGTCMDINGSGDVILSACALVGTAGSTVSITGTCTITSYNNVATKPVDAGVTENVDAILVSANVI